MEKVSVAPDKSVLRFHRCELVEAWRKRGLKEEEVANLCRLARFGNLGMVSNFAGLELDFPSAIADGKDYCELEISFSKKEG